MTDSLRKYILRELTISPFVAVTGARGYVARFEARKYGTLIATGRTINEAVLKLLKGVDSIMRSKKDATLYDNILGVDPTEAAKTLLKDAGKVKRADDIMLYVYASKDSHPVARRIAQLLEKATKHVVILNKPISIAGEEIGFDLGGAISSFLPSAVKAASGLLNTVMPGLGDAAAAVSAKLPAGGVNIVNKASKMIGKILGDAKKPNATKKQKAAAQALGTAYALHKQGIVPPLKEEEIPPALKGIVSPQVGTLAKAIASAPPQVQTTVLKAILGNTQPSKPFAVASNREPIGADIPTWDSDDGRMIRGAPLAILLNMRNAANERRPYGTMSAGKVLYLLPLVEEELVQRVPAKPKRRLPAWMAKSTYA